MNSQWQFNSVLAFLDRPLSAPPFSTGDQDIDSYLGAEIDRSRTDALKAHAAASPLLARPLVVRSYLFVFFARLHAMIAALPTWDKQNVYRRETDRSVAILGELAKADLIFAPRQAEDLFANAMQTIFRLDLLDRCVDLAIKARDGIDGGSFQRAMKYVTDGLPAKEFVGGYGVTNKTQLLATIERAHQALGNPAGSHKISRSLAQARRDGADLMARLKSSVRPELLPLIAQYEVKYPAHTDMKAVKLLQEDLAKSAPELRSAIIDNVLSIQGLFTSSPLVNTIWLSPRDRALGLDDIDAIWTALNNLPALLSARALRFSNPTALAMLKGVKDYKTVLQEARWNNGATAVRGIELKTSVPLLKCLGGSLPRGDRNIEQQIRNLPVADKYKNALLDTSMEIERTGSLDAVQNEARQTLANARSAYQRSGARLPGGNAAARPAPQPAAEPQGKQGGFANRFRAIFGQRSDAPRPAVPHTLPSTTQYQQFNGMKPYIGAVVHALCCNVDVADDFRHLQDLRASQLPTAVSQLGLTGTVRTADDLRKLSADAHYEIRNWAGVLAEFFEAMEWASSIDALSPELRRELAGVVAALLPIPDTSTPPAEWQRRAGDVVGADTASLVETVLASYSASGRWGVMPQQDLVQALIWLGPKLPSGIASRIGDFASYCLDDIPGQGTRNKRLGNAALWALSEMPAAAGVGSLETIISTSAFPSVQQLAREYLNKSAIKGGADPVRAGEMAFPDCGLANGPARLPLKAGAALFTFVAPDRIDLTWQREDGKVGALAGSLQTLDPEGVKAAKKRATTLEADLASAAIWMPTHYRSGASMPFAEWTSRYLDHGTFGPIARNLIWRASSDDASFEFVARGATFVAADGTGIDPRGMEISLWHPLDSTVEALDAWRSYGMANSLSQAFPQIWRPVFKADDAHTWMKSIQGRAISHDPFSKAAKKAGWKAPPSASAHTPGDCAFWFDEETLTYVELAVDSNAGLKDDTNMETLKTGALTFWRGELGAKPSARGLKKKKPLEVSAIDPKLLSEIVYAVMLMTNIGANVVPLPFEIYGERHKYDAARVVELLDEEAASALPVSQCRVDLVKAWVRSLPQTGRAGPTQERLTLDHDWLRIAGKVNSYTLHLPTARLRSTDKAKRVSIMHSEGRPGSDIFAPHAGDSIFSRMLFDIEHLLNDDKPGQKKISIW